MLVPNFPIPIDDDDDADDSETSESWAKRWSSSPTLLFRRLQGKLFALSIFLELCNIYFFWNLFPCVRKRK